MESLEMLKKYFGQNLGDFFGHTTNRLMLYPFLFSFFLVECSTFWLFYQGPSFVIDFMAFTTVYTLHKAAVYTICIFAADLLVHHLAPSWGTYKDAPWVVNGSFGLWDWQQALFCSGLWSKV